jgi:hypothetical protein
LFPAAPEATIAALAWGALTVVSDKECMSYAAECVRLAGLTDNVIIRDQLLDLAQDWIFAAQRAPSPGDDARDNVVPLQKNRDDRDPS